MEVSPQVISPENEKPGSKTEDLIAKSHFAGNFSATWVEADKEKDIFMISLDTISDYIKYLPFLPRGYGFTGGIGRGALLGLLGEKAPKPIDIDIEVIDDLNPDYSKQRELEETFTQNGRIEEMHRYDSLIRYFSTRDFTINEVFLYGNNLYFSRRAAEDVEKKIIKPTEFETSQESIKDTEHSDWEMVKPKLLVKALLLQIEFMKLYGRGSIHDIETWMWEFEGIRPFYVALALDKAVKKGAENEFLEKIFELGFVAKNELPDDENSDKVRSLARLLQHMMLEEGGGGFVYSDDYFNQEYPEEWRAEDDKKMEEYKKAIRHAVKIGKDIPPEDLEDPA